LRPAASALASSQTLQRQPLIELFPDRWLHLQGICSKNTRPDCVVADILVSFQRLARHLAARPCSVCSQIYRDMHRHAALPRIQIVKGYWGIVANLAARCASNDAFAPVPVARGAAIEPLKSTHSRRLT
jgi:hypothetical protein